MVGLRRLAENLAAERSRWILWLPVVLGAGVALYFSLAVEPPRWAGPVLAGAALAAVAASLRAVRYLVPALGILAVAIGFAAAQWRSHDVAAPVLAAEIHHRLVTGDIVSMEPHDARVRMTLDVAAIDGLADGDTPARIRVTAASSQLSAASPGRRIAVRATLRPPPAPALPGGFDFRRVAWFQQIGAIGFVTGDVRVVSDGAAPSPTAVMRFALGIERARLAIAESVRAALPGPSGAVAAALMVGERGAIPPDVRAAMQRSGLAHLLAISGLHVGLVAGFVFFLIRSVFAAWPGVVLRHPVKKWAAAGALLSSAAYLLLAGATVPTQRAFVMTGLVLVAVMLDRRGISMRLVAWAATIILLLRPEALLNVSFQMSFAAVVALVAVYEDLGDRFRRSLGERRMARRALVYFASILVTTVVASLATAPFAIFHFNQFALYSVVANLTAIPVAAFWVMPLIVISFALTPFGLEGLAMPLLGAGIDLIIRVALTVASWPGASVNVAAPPVAGLALAVVGGLWLCLWRRRWRFAGALPIVVGLASIALTEPPNLLISADGKLTGVLARGGTLLISNVRAQPFVREQWLRRTGAADWRAFPEPAEGQVLGMRCDRAGCIFQEHGKKIALLHQARALAEDCRRADILVARFSVPASCTAPAAVVDWHARRAGGSHALSWSLHSRPAEVTIETSSLNGHRLWRDRRNVR